MNEKSSEKSPPPATDSIVAQLDVRVIAYFSAVNLQNGC